jgi:preprotein translocase subunit YajC
MKDIWLLARAGDEAEPGTITSEPISEGEAVTNVPAEPNAAGPKTMPPRSPLTQMLPLIIILVAMYLLLFRGPRRKQQQHQKMVKSLKKNDKVRTIGGILGTVVDIRDDEIILKVDESTNTKIRISASAIGKNLSQD